MIQLHNFSIGFGERKLLDKVSTTFPSGKLTALIGKNGSGKSTLLKALCGLNKKYEGEILLEGKNLRDIPQYKLASIISYVNTQRPRVANLRCNEIVALGRSLYTNWHGHLNNLDKEIIDNALEKVGMKDYKNRYFNSLSDGESQKIMIARALSQNTPLILLDEPTSFLDLPSRYELVSLLKILTEENDKTIIFSTHELDITLKFADYISLFDTPSLINLPTLEMIEYIKTKKHPFGCFL